VLDAIRKGQRWLTAIFIVAIGVVFVFFIGLGGPMEQSGPSSGAVVELGDIRLGQDEFLRVRARQEESYREQLGDQFDPRAIREMLDTMAVGSLVQSAILAHEAKALGMRVGKTEIQRLLRNSPSFRDENGKFSNEIFSRYVEWEYGSQRNYLRYMQRVLLAQKLASLLYSQPQISQAELRATVVYGQEQVELAYVALDAEVLPPEVEITDEQIDDALVSHEVEIQELYEQRREDYELPAQAKVRHILFAVERDADESEVEPTHKRAEEALSRLQAGEEFEALAAELSEDPASKDQGGDLGVVKPGELAAEIEELAFSLESGATSELTRSDAGFHIVRVDERLEARTQDFEEVRRELAREQAETLAARSRAEDLSQRLATAIRAGETLEQAARDKGLTLERTDPLHRRADGFVPGLGSASELLATAFAMNDGQSSPHVFTVGSKLVLVQLLKHQEPDPEEVESQMQARQDQLQDAKRNALIETWIQQRRQELEEQNLLLIDDSIIRRG
jgi:peptidyl-prolyl cis-trans isomerase D